MLLDIFTYGFIAIIFAALVYALIVGEKNKRAMVSAGTMTNFETGFYQKEHTYHMRKISFDEVKAAISNIDTATCEVSLEYKEDEHVILFLHRNNQFIAYLTEQNSADDNSSSYSFLFGGYGDVLKCLASMNKTLTAVEKTMLQLDPNAQTSIQKLQYKNL